MLQKYIVALIAIVCTVCVSSFSGAAHPTAPQLFPDTTLAYARIDNMTELRERWSKTSVGKLLADPQISPFFQEIYGSLIESARSFEESVGLSIDEMLQIPQGEVAVAIVPTELQPAICFFIEAGDRIPELMILIDRARELSNRGEQRREKISFVELFSEEAVDENEEPSYFIDQGVLVFTNNRDVAIQMAKVWTDNASGHNPLASKSSFLDILTRCAGINGERPQVSFFVDPMAIVKDSTKRNPGMMAVAAMLPVLGVDGIKGVGGSAIFAPEGFDSILHMHLLIGSPRRAMLSVVRPKEGPIDPETWVPEDVSSYMTINWRTQSTLTAFADLFNTINGEDAFKNNVINGASKQLKVDFQKDVLDQFDDRFSVVQLQLRPARVNSGSNVLAIKLKDAVKFERDTLPKIFDAVSSKNKSAEMTKVNDLSVIHIVQEQRGSGPRRPDPAVCIIDDRLLISDSLQAIEQIVQSFQSSDSLLINSLEFKVIKQRISDQVAGMKVCGLTMSRPEETLRVFYDMAADPANRERLAEMANNNPFFTALNNALQNHQLPPFDVIRKYLAPTGGFVSEDDSGIHYTAFGLQRN